MSVPSTYPETCLIHLEDFSDTMGDFIEGCNLNIGPSSAEAPPPLGYALRDLFLEQNPVAT